MPYVDLTYYLDTYGGDWPSNLSSEDFSKIESRAASVIDSLTNLSIQTYGFENLHPLIQEAVKKAVCAQIEFIIKNGTDVLHGAQLSSVGIGDFSYQVSSASNKETSFSGVSPEVMLHLSSSGLLYAGVKVL